MSLCTEISPTLKHTSSVFGLDLTVTAGVEPSLHPEEGIAHAEYYFIEVFTDGTNTSYPKVAFPQVVLFFVEPDVTFISGVQDGILYASMYTDIPIGKITLDENTTEEKHLGANIIIWSKDEVDMICEFLVAPLRKIRH